MSPCYGHDCIVKSITAICVVIGLIITFCRFKSKNKTIVMSLALFLAIQLTIALLQDAKTRTLLTTKDAVDKDFVAISSQLTADADITTEAKVI